MPKHSEPSSKHRHLQPTSRMKPESAEPSSKHHPLQPTRRMKPNSAYLNIPPSSGHLHLQPTRRMKPLLEKFSTFFASLQLHQHHFNFINNASTTRKSHQRTRS